MGYCATTKAYRIWCPKTRKIVVNCDVIFYEEIQSQFKALMSDDKEII